MRLLLAAAAFIFVFPGNSAVGQVAAVKFIVTVPNFAVEKSKNIHLVGSFNGWKPNDSLYIMNREKENTYSLIIPLFEGKQYEYKYTLGDWSSVEISKNDSEINNRRMFSKNQMSLSDTVSKWKTPGPPKAPSLQMQKLLAMKDSLKLQLQSTLNNLLVILEKYNEAMLSPRPNERLRKKLNRQTIKIIDEFYKMVEQNVWTLGTSLPAEQKKKIFAAIKNPERSKDILTTLGNAYGDAFK